MHPNPAFRGAPEARNLAFARDRGFGLLAGNGPDGPMAAHVPFALDAAGAVAELHLVRSNPMARALAEGPLPALLAVSGPDGYVSPDWYALDHDQVPTWNYVAVHLRGQLSLLPAAAMRGHLDRLSAGFEARLLPKAPWTMGKMSPEAIARMMRQILPCRLAVEQVSGTWKLNQNKPEQGRLRAADAMAGSAVGVETARLAALMRHPDG